MSLIIRGDRAMSDGQIPEKTEKKQNDEPHILIVEDDDSIRDLLKALLERHHMLVTVASDGFAALEALNMDNFQCVLTDLRMPKMSGEELCRRVMQLDSQLPVIILTAYGNIQNAVDNMKNGAFDYVTKPFNEKDLLTRIQRAVEKRLLDEQIREVRSKVFHRRSSDLLIGSSETISRIHSQIHTISKNDVTVLITGESGTGKELVARTVHLTSKQKDNKFVTVNCGAIPENLMESELFGHVKGSFTGAIADKLGLFEEANGGTIFLDEIGDLPLSLQVKFLRVLQESEIRRVGDNKNKKIDVRVIAATNKELKAEVDSGNFREDLYYRINVFPIHVAPLRERRDDIPILTSLFIEQCNKELKVNIQGISSSALKKMMRYRWPGNVRELQNKIKQAMIVTRRKEISAEDLLLQLPSESEGPLSFRDAKKKFEREYLVQLLKMTAGNITEASKIARKDRKDFYDVMKKHGIHPEEFRT